MDSRQWWTIPQIAQAVGVDQETVRRWIRNGRLKATSLGSNRAGYRIARGDLASFVEKWYGETLGERLGETETAA